MVSNLWRSDVNICLWSMFDSEHSVIKDSSHLSNYWSLISVSVCAALIRNTWTHERWRSADFSSQVISSRWAAGKVQRHSALCSPTAVKQRLNRLQTAAPALDLWPHWLTWGSPETHLLETEPEYDENKNTAIRSCEFTLERRKTSNSHISQSNNRKFHLQNKSSYFTTAEEASLCFSHQENGVNRVLLLYSTFTL